MANVLEFNNVWKKFKRGEKFNSLRDAIPNLVKSLTGKQNGLMDDREFWAVKDVNFHIKKGEVVGIMGPNGAGKSTILKLLSRIIIPSKGSMKINGRLSALIEVTAGFHPELTGRENVYLNGTILGMKRREIESKFEEIVDFSGIREFIDTPVKRYSSGMYSRLGFSVAAHMDPEILLVDEVLAVGDMAFRAKCAQKMRELLTSGCTIVLVSHQLSLIQGLCQRVILLNHGEVIKDGPTDDVIPLYQNIVFKKQEEEFKKKISSQSDEKVKVKDESALKILNVSLNDGAKRTKETFGVDESLSMAIEIEAKHSIDNPAVCVDIVRADGVLCCSLNSKNYHFSIGSVNGRKSVQIDFGKMNLASGIYLVRCSIWDKDMVHPYDIRRKDVFRIEDSRVVKDSANPVFFVNPVWSQK